jgi:hypothetical protein
MKVDSRPTELDVAQYSIDLPISQNLDDFRTAQRIVVAGWKELTRHFPRQSRRWSRWRTWWMFQLAERNLEWVIAEKHLRQAIADRGVRGTDRTAACAALGRVLGRLEEQSAERARVLRGALSLGVRHPDPTLFSIVGQLEQLRELTWSGPARSAVGYLVTKCIDPPGHVPRDLNEMRQLVRKWNRKEGMT